MSRQKIQLKILKDKNLIKKTSELILLIKKQIASLRKNPHLRGFKSFLVKEWEARVCENFLKKIESTSVCQVIFMSQPG